MSIVHRIFRLRAALSAFLSRSLAEEGLGGGKKAAYIDEKSSLRIVIGDDRDGIATFERRFRVSLTPGDIDRSLEFLVKRYNLPPAQIVFAEMQRLAQEARSGTRDLPPNDVDRAIGEDGAALIDCRESWERDVAPIEGAMILDEPLWDELRRNWDRDRPLILFCHHGLRSADAAPVFVTEGFTNVRVIVGGLEGWAQVSTRKLPRYEAPAC